MVIVFLNVPEKLGYKWFLLPVIFIIGFLWFRFIIQHQEKALHHKIKKILEI